MYVILSSAVQISSVDISILSFSDVKRDIEHVEKYSQEDAIKKLLRALHDSNDPRWLDIFKKALAQERNVFMYFPLLNLQANMQIGDTART